MEENYLTSNILLKMVKLNLKLDLVHVGEHKIEGKFIFLEDGKEIPVAVNYRLQRSKTKFSNYFCR